MKIQIEKSPITILWLDTWYILELTRTLNGFSKKEKKIAEDIVEKIMTLTKQKKLLCPEGDQGIEIEASNNRQLVENAQRLQARLSLGISLLYHKSVENLQVQRMMEAFIKNQKEVIFPWKDLFFRNPVEEINKIDSFIISVITNPKREELDKRIKTNKSIANAWEKLRIKAKKDKQDYKTILEAEFGGKAEAMVYIMAKFAAKIIHKKRIFIREIFQLNTLVDKPLSWWERYCGKEEDLVGVLKFYKSQEYRQIPIINIGTRLLAELVSGNEKISQGDVMDIHHISTVMPYAEYMLVDNSMKNRIKDKLKLIKEFPCKLISQKDLLPLLNSLA